MTLEEQVKDRFGPSCYDWTIVRSGGDAAMWYWFVGTDFKTGRWAHEGTTTTVDEAFKEMLALP
jgi:hypothetical protein